MKAKYKRLNFIILIFALVSSGLYIILKNFNENIIFFYSPSDLKQKNILNTTIRIGGLIVKDSIKTLSESRIEFTITDQKEEVTIIYQGLLPNLFREGQGIVAKGKYYNSGEKKSIFIATELLAKHDENYMPKEITNSLKNRKCSGCKHTTIQNFGSNTAIFIFTEYSHV